MRLNFYEIEKDKYEDMKSRPYGEVNKEIENNLDPITKWGYGYYGFVLKEEEGKYFVGYKTGDSCD